MKSLAIAALLCLFVTKPQVSSSSEKFNQHQRKDQMKQFSLLVRVPTSYTSEQAKSVNPKWENLLTEWKAENAYVLSFAFPGESYTISGLDNTVKQETVLSGSLRVVSNIVLQAGSFEEAIELAKRCPILAFGGSVEVREIQNPLRPQ